MNPKRHYNKWTVSEVLKLQREYELLGMPISEIAKLHDRSEFAIICKIEQECFTSEQQNSVNMVTTLNSITPTMTTRSKTTNTDPFVPIVKKMVTQFIEKKKRRALQPLRKSQTIQQTCFF